MRYATRARATRSRAPPSTHARAQNELQTSVVHRELFLTSVGRLDTYRRAFKLHFNWLLSGGGGTGKSFVVTNVAYMCIDGTYVKITHKVSVRARSGAMLTQRGLQVVIWATLAAACVLPVACFVCALAVMLLALFNGLVTVGWQPPRPTRRTPSSPTPTT